MRSRQWLLCRCATLVVKTVERVDAALLLNGQREDVAERLLLPTDVPMGCAIAGTEGHSTPTTSTVNAVRAWDIGASSARMLAQRAHAVPAEGRVPSRLRLTRLPERPRAPACPA